MKKTLIVSLFIILTSRCDSQSTKLERTNLTLDQKDRQTEILSGLWMSDAYLQKIEKTKSVYKNKKSEPKLLGLLIRKENLRSDSAFIFGFDSHEGGYEIPVYFNSSTGRFVCDKKRARQSSDFSNSFELKAIDDQKLQISLFQEKQLETYRKVKDVQSEFRKILFDGKFKSVDGNQEFVFDDTGLLTGFGNKKTFEVIYDFGLNIEFDAIVMYESEGTSNWSDGEVLKFEFTSDMLKLYHVNTNWSNMNHTIGDLKYELKRMKP